MAEAEEERGPEETQPTAPPEGPEGPEERPAAPPEGPVERAAARPEGPEERPAARPEGPEERPAAPPEGPEERPAARPQPPGDLSEEPSLHQFKTRRFFVLRPGTLKQAIKDVEALVDEEVDGSVHGIWLTAEVDHWDNEKERLVLITDNSLLVFKYDFVMFNCDQMQRIPLNIIDRIAHGPFSFPKNSLLQRDGEGLRVFWDRLREPSFSSRWNPFATDFPFVTFIDHPVRSVSDAFAALCDMQTFRERLKEAAQKAHAMKPFPGKANGVLVLNQQIHIQAYVGLMSFIGNQNKLGYCMARGNIGF